MRSVTVFGSAQPQPGSAAYEQAQDLGRRLAQAGIAVVNGGYAGTMEGVSRGAAEAGGRARGVTCAAFDKGRSGGNAYLSEVIHTPDLLARLRKLVELGDAYLVLDGGVGTLLELFLVWNLRAINVDAKPCILIGHHWRQVLDGLTRHTQIGPQHTAMLRIVDTNEQALDLLRLDVAGQPG
jgi:uncharacterized protein (TIGR00730 family)